MRTALLAAVSHDLRTPLASAKAAVTSLRSPDVAVRATADRGELLATADESLDRLTRLVENLLDMSRLQAGALSVVTAARSAWTTCVPPALDELGPAGRQVDRADRPDDLPEVRADPGLLERILVNLARQRAAVQPTRARPADRHRQRHTATGSSSASSTTVPASPKADWDRVFLPFQRLGDRDNTTGVGLGLALSRGLAEAMGGTLTPETHPRRRADHGPLPAGRPAGANRTDRPRRSRGAAPVADSRTGARRPVPAPRCRSGVVDRRGYPPSQGKRSWPGRGGSAGAKLAASSVLPVPR